MEQEPVVKYITWGLIQDPFKVYLKQFENFKIVHNMDTNLNSNGNSKQVENLTNLTKPLHPYLEADISLDTESKQILQTLSSPLDKAPPLTDLGPIDPDIFASPPPKKR